MCGRYALTLPPEAVRRFFGYPERPNFPPRYNIAPTQPIAILRGGRDGQGGPSRRFSLARWGFIPAFVKDPARFPLIVNARCGGLAVKPSFAAAFKRRRCAILADAFYEWRRDSRRPYLFRRRDGAPMALAGLWEDWTGPNGEQVETACIVTTSASRAASAVHDRLPAMIERDSLDLWLRPDEEAAREAAVLLRVPPDDALEFFEIGPAVNKAANDHPGVQSAAEPERQRCDQSRLF